MEKLPEYATAAYWEARYDSSDASVPNLADANGSRYDWYLDYTAKPSASPLRTILRASAPPAANPRVLDVGCGDSALCAAMASDGYCVHGVDPSSSAMAVQKRLSAEAAAAGPPPRGGTAANAVCGDGRRLPFASRCFDAVVEKGTLDAILCGPEAGSALAAARALLREASRVLRDGGTLFSISYSAPQERGSLLNALVPRCSEVRVHRVPRAHRNDFTGRRWHYVYVCRIGVEPVPSEDEACVAVELGESAPDTKRRRTGGGELDEQLRQQQGADLDAQLTAGIVADDKVEVVELLARGASAIATTQGDLAGTTPCMLAAGVGAIKCLPILCSAAQLVAGAASVRECADLLGRVALHHAALGGQLATLAYLLEHCHGGDPQLPSAEGALPVQMAAAAGSVRCVRLLLQCSGAPAADAKQGDRTGFTPLHAAAFRGHGDVCKVLLEAGADASAVCHTTRFGAAGARQAGGQTCASLAEQAGHCDVAAMLRAQYSRTASSGAASAPPT